MRMYCHTGSFSSINQMVFDFPKIYVEAPRPVLVLELWITVAFVQCYKDLTVPEHGVVAVSYTHLTLQSGSVNVFSILNLKFFIYCIRNCNKTCSGCFIGNHFVDV